jgi:UDP-N-acetyl-D-glucosamine/UDP-N-acetyl-D-galactosamine dehydrogenase
LKRNAVVVFESTVYPGVTEDVCAPVLEKASGLTAGRDFFLGYSPERINPGDRDHTVDKITKVIAGQTPEVTQALAELYGAVTSGGVFVAKNIKTAEAAKVIENAQRDINIAFINEVTMIFNRLGLSTHDVLAAAKTKWNFLKFEPGLVGGHCIGVDPFYLAHLAKELGHDPEVILAGRRINDNMAKFAAERIHDWLAPTLADRDSARILVLGLTFKENVPDLRNTKAVDMVKALKALGHHVDVHDAMADPAEAERFYGLKLLTRLEKRRAYDCLVGAVPHAVYIAFSGNTLTSLVKPGGMIVDLKGMWRHAHIGADITRFEI